MGFGCSALSTAHPELAGFAAIGVVGAFGVAKLSVSHPVILILPQKQGVVFFLTRSALLKVFVKSVGGSPGLVAVVAFEVAEALAPREVGWHHPLPGGVDRVPARGRVMAGLMGLQSYLCASSALVACGVECLRAVLTRVRPLLPLGPWSCIPTLDGLVSAMRTFDVILQSSRKTVLGRVVCSKEHFTAVITSGSIMLRFIVLLRCTARSKC